jgi:hypothetical protein
MRAALLAADRARGRGADRRRGGEQAQASDRAILDGADRRAGLWAFVRRPCEHVFA